jgi:hypothetical protein
MSALAGVEFSVLLRGATVIACVLGIALCSWLALTSRERLRSTRILRIGHIDLPAVSFYKLLGLFGMFMVPVVAVSLASHELFVGTKESSACVQCHVMNPYGNDMIDPASDLLAARHYRNRWIHEKQCYQCHVDYGFSGTLTAKMDGLRHLLKYTSRTYVEPIGLIHPFNNANCLHCHAGTPKYDAETMHEVMADVIAGNETPCTSCHGNSHPSREQRSPGHADYDRLMRPVEMKK